MDKVRWGLGTVVALLGLGGCSSSSAPATSDAGDGGKAEAAVKDVALEPLPPFDGQYGGDGGSPGTGTMLTSFYGAVIDGITSDGWVVYSNGGEVPTFYAANLTGGTTVDLGLAQSYGYAIVTGDVAFLFTSIDVDDNTYASPLSIWTSKGGQHTLTQNSFLENAAVSSDDTWVLYYDNLNPSNQTGDLYVAKTDGSSAAVLAPSLPGLAPGGSCEPNFGFAGTTAFVAWCPTGSTTSVSISTFALSAGAWSATNTLTAATSPAITVDPTNTYLAYVDSAGLEYVPLAGGTPTLIDATGTYGVFTKSGTSIVYPTSAKSLDRATIGSADAGADASASEVLVASGVDGIYGLSPTNTTAVVFSAESSGLANVYTASATTPGSLTKLTSATSSTVPGFGVFDGDAFTADSSQVLFFTSIQSSPEGSPFGALYAGVASSGAVTELSASSNTVWAYGAGTKVVYADNLLFEATTTLDIKAADVTGGPTTLISHGATAGSGAAFFLSPDKTKIVYSWTSPGTENGGIYVAPVP
jgi:hypothetical protein